MRYSALLIICGLALGQAACATNTKGSWACAADRGVPCASIDTIDHTDVSARATATKGRAGASGPLIEGATPARWWNSNDSLGGQFANAPRREADQYVKVMIGGWVDASGDYHAPSEIYAVMRRGGWWTSPSITPLNPLRPASTSRPPAAASPAPGAASAKTASAAQPAGSGPTAAAAPVTATPPQSIAGNS